MENYIVYKHTNKTNNKVYIGITCQAAKNRWKSGRGYHGLYFGRAIKKYGWDGFKHEIIAENLSEKDACEMERILIKAFNATDPDFGYNQTEGGKGGGMLNHHHTEEAKDRIRQARIRDGFTEEHKKHISESKRGVKHHFAKKVYQYTKEGQFIREWEYMSLAAKELGINKSNIGETCNGHRPSAGGYFWSYERV